MVALPLLSRWLPLLAPLLTCGFSLGCASSAPVMGGLKLKKIDVAAHEPSNVAVYFSVETKEGEPVVDVQPANIKIYEDGKLVPEKKAKRLLLDPRAAAAQYTLLLLDLSGPTVDSEYMPELVTAVSRFAERLGRSQQVAVSVFEGEDELSPVLTFGAKEVRKTIDPLRAYRPQNRTSNLNWAIVEGLTELEEKVESAKTPHAYGSLVIFTDRGDLAKKTTPEALKAALDKTDADVYVVAVGSKVQRWEIDAIARSGSFISERPNDLMKGFDEITKRLEADSARYYLLSYCSPKRKGEHELEIEIASKQENARLAGKLKHRFSADGFKHGCNPKRRPIFEEEKGDKEE